MPGTTSASAAPCQADSPQPRNASVYMAHSKAASTNKHVPAPRSQPAAPDPEAQGRHAQPHEQQAQSARPAQPLPMHQTAAQVHEQRHAARHEDTHVRRRRPLRARQHHQTERQASPNTSNASRPVDTPGGNQPPLHHSGSSTRAGTP